MHCGQVFAERKQSCFSVFCEACLEIAVAGRNGYHGKQRILKLHLEGSKNKTQRWSDQQKQLHSPSDTPLIVTETKISVL